MSRTTFVSPFLLVALATTQCMIETGSGVAGPWNHTSRPITAQDLNYP